MTDTETQILDSSSTPDIDLTAGHTSISLTHVTWIFRTAAGFIFHWLREVSRGIVGGNVNVRVPDTFRSEFRLTIHGPLRATVSTSASGELRLRCYTDGPNPIQASALSESFDQPENSQLTDLLLGTTDLAGGWRLLLQDPEALDRRSRSSLRHFEASLGDEDGSYRSGRLRDLVQNGLAFRDRIVRKAVSALEKKISAQLAARLCFPAAASPLLDVSFSPTPQGLALYEQAAAGDFAAAMSASSDEVRWNSDPLTLAPEDTFLELLMPFLDRREYQSRLQLYSGMEVGAEEDGSLRVLFRGANNPVERLNTTQAILMFSRLVSRDTVASDCTISFSDHRRLSVAQAQHALPRVVAQYGFDEGLLEWLSSLKPSQPDMDVSLLLGISSMYASAWLEAPPIRNQSFTDSFVEAAQSIQKCLRAWLPYIYFNELDRYDNLEAGRSLLVYEACRPSARKKRPEFTYDAMNPASVALALKKSSGALPAILQSVFQLLVDSGEADVAKFYHPKKARDIIASVRRGYRFFTGLLAADAYFMDALVTLASKCRRTKFALAEHPGEMAKSAHRPVLDAMETIHIRLRRIYDRQACVSLGSLLFLEATRALHAVEEVLPPVKAVLRIHFTGDSFAADHVFVNDGWRR